MRANRDRAFYSKLIHLTLPMALQNLMLASVAAADAFMLGRLDQNAMAAVSQASQVQFLQNLFMTVGAGAGAILGAQYWGKGDKRTVGNVFCIMLRLCGGVSLMTFLACALIPGALMRILTNDAQLIALGTGYLRLAAWSYLCTGISHCYLSIMKVSDHAASSAIISSTAVVLNIALNAVFIFGLLGVPAMGIMGAALATLISRVVELLMAVLLSLKKDYIAPPLRGLLRMIGALEKDYWRVCLPLLGGALLWGVGFSSYTAIMGHLGADAAAANSIVAVLRDLICCFCSGVGSAAAIMVGNELGAGRLEKGRLYGDRLMKLSFAVGLASALAVLLIVPPCTRFVKLSEVGRGYLRGMIIVLAVYMIGRSFSSVVINGIFAAGGDTLFDVYSLAATMWGIAIPLALLGAFVFHWPVVAVYACTCLDEVGLMPWTMLHYRKHKWVRDLTRDAVTQTQGGE